MPLRPLLLAELMVVAVPPSSDLCRVIHEEIRDLICQMRLENADKLSPYGLLTASPKTT